MLRQIPSLFLLALWIPAHAWAQRSVVFFPERHPNGQGEYDRPKPRLNQLRSFALPQSIEPHPVSGWNFPNINVTSFLLADEDEPSITINPTNPQNIIIGANDYRSDSSLWRYTSTDGGLHWINAPLNANWYLAAGATDPAVAFNASGKVFFTFGRIAAGIVFPPRYDINDVVCFRSDDNGLLWNGPVRVVLDSTDNNSAAKLADKYFLAVDREPGSQFVNRLYVAWAEYQQNQSRIVVAHSTSNGLSWSDPVGITAAAHFQCPIPAVGMNGDVYVAYEDIDPAHRKIHVCRSGDGGVSFPSDVVVATYNDLGRLYPNDTVNFHPVIKGHVRVNSFPSIAVDHSTAHTGRIYLTYAATDASGRAHIYLCTSDDKAIHWTVPIAVENDANNHPTDKFFPWIAVDQSNGDVGIVCYDSRNDSLANELIDTYLLFSHDGGVTFAPLRITPASYTTQGSSSRDSVGGGVNDSLEFIGDYLGLDASNKHWYPAWTDMRVGYDQDIYIAIVRPYAPASPKDLQAVENAASPLPEISWSYSGLTTAGLSLGGYSFHLRRSDGALDTILPSAARSFTDLTAAKTLNYTYSLQVVTNDGDTSALSFVDFHPRSAWEAQAPILVSGQAQSGGFFATIAIPAYNTAGDSVHGLSKIYFIIDGMISDSGILSDKRRGSQVIQFFSRADGFHSFEALVSTQLPEGDTVLSARTPVRWLYAGAPLQSYSEDFSSDKNVFTPFAWDTTSANGALPSRFINDSLPFVNYQANENTWFCIPPVTIADGTKTLEFDHIAAVAGGDSAIVEYSTDDGVHFHTLQQFDALSYPSQWHNSLSGCTPVHARISFSDLIGHDAVARFRLTTHSSNGDGWFIGNIMFTPASSVNRPLVSAVSDELRMIADPIVSAEPLRAELTLHRNTTITISVYDLLGRKRMDVIYERSVTAGEYRIESPVGLEPGTYILVCSKGPSSGNERITATFIVSP